jgi:hypothetical protein
VRLAYSTLKAGTRGGEVLARHQGHAWLVRQRRFFRLDCESQVRLQFENEYGESSPPHRAQLYWPERVVKSASAP